MPGRSKRPRGSSRGLEAPAPERNGAGASQPRGCVVLSGPLRARSGALTVPPKRTPLGGHPPFRESDCSAGINLKNEYLTEMKNRLPILVLSLLFLFAVGCSAQTAQKDTTPAMVEVPEGMETAVVGAGCFWCVEVFYEKLEGVHEAVSGYAGGEIPNPRYEQVARGATQHVEVVQVIYDPSVVTYRELIDFFWTTHDATRDDGVWPDFGPQYRSILFYENEAQRAAIQASREAYEASTGKVIATEVRALDIFYSAETYHQDYAAKNPNDRYVRGVLNPKLKKLGLD